MTHRLPLSIIEYARLNRLFPPGASPGMLLARGTTKRRQGAQGPRGTRQCVFIRVRSRRAMAFRLIVSEAVDLTTIRVAGLLRDDAVTVLGDTCAGARGPLVLDLSDSDERQRRGRAAASPADGRGHPPAGRIPVHEALARARASVPRASAPRRQRRPSATAARRPSAAPWGTTPMRVVDQGPMSSSPPIGWLARLPVSETGGPIRGLHRRYSASIRCQDARCVPRRGR